MRVQEITLQTPRYKLAAKVWGPEDGLPVLALHGWLDNAASFDFIAPHLKNIRLVALDLPGHGLSAHKSAQANYYSWEYVQDVLSVLEALNWQQCALLGHSLGASIAILFAGTFPEKITHVGLIEGLGPTHTEAKEAPHQLIKGIRASQMNRPLTVYASVAEAVQARMAHDPSLSSEAARVLVERSLKKTDEGFVWSTDTRLKRPSLLRMTEDQVLAFIKKITAPACLLFDTQSPFSKEAVVESRIETFNNITLHIHKGGHHLHMNGEVEKVAQLLNTFFAE